MEFPPVDRVVYASNPLTEVVFQLRFPRILAVDDRLPADFQLALGDNYPLIQTREGLNIPAFLQQDASGISRTHYDFLTEDKSVVVTLVSDFLAVTTKKYVRWENFKAHIECAVAALCKTYQIKLFSRVGLRYVDQISRRKLNLTNERWSDLVRNSALGIVSEDAVLIEDVLEMQNVVVVKLAGGAKAAIRFGFTSAELEEDEKIFVVDSDFFSDRVMKDPADALVQCNAFNKFAGHAFRWFITDKLHDALGPQQP